MEYNKKDCYVLLLLFAAIIKEETFFRSKELGLFLHVCIPAYRGGGTSSDIRCHK